MANVVYVDDSDSRIEYLGGWQTATDRRAHGSTLHALSGGGGGQTLTFNFTGTRIGIIGCAGDTDRFGFPGTAYDIDEIPQKIIIGVSHTYADTFTYNYTWFESEDLSPGEHSLRITAINTTAPNVYWVDYIWYLTATTTAPLPSIASSQLPTNSPLPSATSTPTSAAPSTTSATTTADDLGPAPNLLTTSSTTSTSSSSSTPSSTVSINSSAGKTSHPRNVGAIVGGTVGGAVFVTLLAVLAFFLLRRSGSSTKPLRDRIRHEKPQKAQLGRNGSLFSVVSPRPQSTFSPASLLPTSAPSSEVAPFLSSGGAISPSNPPRPSSHGYPTGSSGPPTYFSTPAHPQSTMPRPTANEHERTSDAGPLSSARSEADTAFSLPPPYSLS